MNNYFLASEESLVVIQIRNTIGVLFFFSIHIIRIDALARAFSSFYPSRKQTRVAFESLNEVC